MYRDKPTPFDEWWSREMKQTAVSPDIRKLLAQAYEGGFVDGMQHQMQSSVDKAVNAISRQWVGLTSDNFNDFNPLFKAEEAVRWAEAKLKEKNT
jgi:hypothetical protein